MDKPVSVAIFELKENIRAAAAQSLLPPCVLEPVFAAYAAQLALLAAAEKQRDENSDIKKEEDDK